MRARISIAVVLLTLMAVALAPSTAVAAPPAPEFHYVGMSDGEEIAVKVFYPPDYVEGGLYPVLFTMEGYGGAGGNNDSTFNNRRGYMLVAASVRGTGCSSGQLDLFSDRSALDGKELIDNWMPTQRWFNGEVGIFGHSYAGLTGFLVAAQTPQNLKAIAVSGLIDDFYRGILFPGGIPNPGFPVLWGAGVRPAGEHQANFDELQNDQHCRENYADHQGSSALNVKGLLDTYPNREARPDSWPIQAGLMNKIRGIAAPIQMGQQYQDEQTGPRGAHVLWENVPKDVPKRLVLSTGRHNPNDPRGTKADWLDCWILHDGSPDGSLSGGRTCAAVIDPEKKVLAYFESKGSQRLAPYVSGEWPLRETDWTRYYLRTDGTLGTSVTGAEGTTVYASSGTGRQMTGDVGGLGPGGLAEFTYAEGLPDTARYQLAFDRPTAVAGPSTLTLHASTTSTDVDFFVEVLDVDLATGETTFVQRGLQRGSFAGSFDPALSAKVHNGKHRGEIYRPYHRFVGPQPLIPGEVNEFQIEVFPFGHVFRAGHAMVVQVHAPPANDPISTYAYEPNQAGIVTIYQDADHLSSILLPVMRSLPPIWPTAPACGEVVGEVCVTPSL
ncbi:MAG TPA: CocE/NonD family hydrolase [Actinomycetota bacterium]|nr:CocE/NonD family hydrolase [Actinomycetota bacterium]